MNVSTEPKLFHPYADKVNTILMRHGEALSNVHSDLYRFGHDDILGLTARGIHQVEGSARLLKGMLKANGVKRIWMYVSDTVRAIQSAFVARHVMKNTQFSDCEIEVRTLEWKGTREFYEVNSGREPEGWDFKQFMADPHGLDFGPEVRTPYEHYFYASSGYRMVTEQVVREAKNEGIEGPPTVLWVGHHFLFNMVRLYLSSLEHDREQGTCLNDYLTVALPESTNTMFLEPRFDPTEESPIRATITPRSVAMAVNHWATNDPEVLNYVSVSRELLESALHVPMQNADFILKPHEPAMLGYPNYTYMPEGWKMPRDESGLWFDFRSQYDRLKQAYKALINVPKS